MAENEFLRKLPPFDTNENDGLPDNENIENQQQNDTFLKTNFTIGYNVDILENNYLEFTLSYIPFDDINIRTLQNIEKENSISVTSKNPLLITKWNYINYGITNNNKLFLQVINNKFDFDNAEIATSDEIELPGISLNYFINKIIKNETETIYDTNLQVYDSDVDNLYFKFPPILIGGVENKNKSSQMFKTTDVAKIPNAIKKLKLQPNINNGFEDFEISTFRYFNKELSKFEKQDEYKIYDIKNSNLEIKDNCYIDLQFDEIDSINNQIDDKSGNANHAHLIGDMKINIYNDGSEYEITDKFLPEIKNEQGPY